MSYETDPIGSAGLLLRQVRAFADQALEHLDDGLADMAELDIERLLWRGNDALKCVRGEFKVKAAA